MDMVRLLVGLGLLAMTAVLKRGAALGRARFNYPWPLPGGGNASEESVRRSASALSALSALPPYCPQGAVAVRLPPIHMPHRPAVD
jgi:hypothetical protein